MFSVKPQKLSEKIKYQLIDRINEMRAKGKKKLPSEDDLAEIYGVSRTTIRVALSELEDSKIVVRKHGQGTFINDPGDSFHISFDMGSKYSERIREFGYEFDVEFISEPEVLTSVSSKIIDALNLEEDEYVVYTPKVLYADDKPAVLIRNYIPVKYITDLKDLDVIYNYEDSIFEFLDSVENITVVTDQAQILTINPKNDHTADKYFGDFKDSLLLLNCINYDTEKRPVLYSEEFVDTEVIKYFSWRRKI